MAETDISICRSALLLLAAEPITSFSEDESDNAVICAGVYPRLRRAIIAKHAWNSFTKKKELTKKAAAPAGEYQSQFQIPGEALREPHALYDSASSVKPFTKYKIIGDVVLTNTQVCIADYVVEKPEGAWRAYFVELMVKAMAAEIAMAITDSARLAEYWRAIAYGTPGEGGLGGEMNVAMTLDAQLSNDSQIDADHFVDSRFGADYA